jgi:hypothetical protein
LPARAGGEVEAALVFDVAARAAGKPEKANFEVAVAAPAGAAAIVTLVTRAHALRQHDSVTDKRFDPNCPHGASYTRRQFLAAYGPAGAEQWDLAKLRGERTQRQPAAVPAPHVIEVEIEVITCDGCGARCSEAEVHEADGVDLCQTCVEKAGAEQWGLAKPMSVNALCL